jgi:uncharacterized protein with GYD domain
MPKYMISGSYTADGLKGLAKDKGTGRVKAVNAACASVGGSVDSFYFAFGETDAIVIADFPDNVSCAAVAIAASASGLVRVKVTSLLTPEEIDQALKLKAGYKGPGKAK